MALNYFTFGPYDSRDFGIYISGSGTFNAPEAEYETAIVPGRNGALLLPEHRFGNVELKYPAYIYTDFNAKIAAMRSAFLGLEGYQRLTDSYHPDEYRLAYFPGDVEVKTTKRLDAGSFTLTFVCKPQRYLVDGEQPVEIGTTWGELTTKTGALVTFDGKAGDAFKSLTTNIDPVQSLNGYDHPWAGGAGKNLWGHGDVSFTSYSEFPVSLNAGTYTFSATVTTTLTTETRCRIGWLDANNTVLETTYINLNARYSSTVTLSQSASAIRLYSAETANKATGHTGTYTGVQLELGSTATDYAPYSNICPINGHTGVNVTVSPTQDAQDGTTYAVSFGSAGTVYGGTVDVVSGELTVDSVSAQIGSYNWTDRISGQNRVYTLATNILSDAPFVYDSFADLSADGKNKCDKLPMTNVVSNPDSASITIGVNAYIYLNGVTHIDASVTDKASLNTWLTANPLQVTFRLATPQTYQLTPAEAEVLLGVNNVWSDAGDVTLQYGTSPFAMVNPTQQTARPLIRVYGYGTLVVGDCTVTIASHAYTYIDIDCDIMDCHYGTTNCNSLVSFSTHEFPTFPPGVTWISFNNTITKVEVEPDWWRA